MPRVCEEKPCVMCNEIYQPNDIRQKYCTPCKKIKKLEDEKLRKRRIRKEKGRKVVGEMSPCATCSTPILISNGGTKYCDECRIIADKGKSLRYKKKNPEKYAEQQRLMREKRKSNVEYKTWRQKYNKHYQKYVKIKDYRYRLHRRMSQLVRFGLKGNKKSRTWVSLVGYTLEELREHMETLFRPGMSWDNMSEWHIDHIIPQRLFKYTSEKDDDFKACWALSNLRPLWAEDNLKKGGKYPYSV